MNSEPRSPNSESRTLHPELCTPHSGAPSEPSTINSQPSTSSPPPADPHGTRNTEHEPNAATNPPIHQSNNPSAARRRRSSKISRFPKEIRDQLNEMLEDGFTYAEIIQQLGEWGTDLNEQNVSKWKNGAHQEWLEEQRPVESCLTSQDLAADLLRDRRGIDSFQAPGKIAAALICEAIADIGAGTIREACKTNPLNLVRMLNSLARLTSGGLKCERHLAEEADRKAKLEKQNAPPKEAGISEERRQYIEKKFNLFPPSAYRRRRHNAPGQRRKSNPIKPNQPKESTPLNPTQA